MIALACALALAAPQALPRTAPSFDRHLRAVRAERTARLRALYASAAEEARAAAAEILRDRRSPGAPLGSRPPLGAIDAAIRSLEAGTGPVDPELAELSATADALDLLPAPGAFDAEGTEAGRGVPITVRLYPVYPAQPPGDLVVTLWWVGPDGERTRARSESALADAFRRPGFDLFVRAPLGAGPWRLESELAPPEGGPAVRGPSVLVHGVPELGERVAAAVERLRSAPPEDGRERERALAALAELRRRVAAGLRPPAGPPLPALLDRIEGGRFAGPVPLFAPGEDPADPETVPWGWFAPAPGESAEAVWVLLTPGQEAPGEAFGAGVPWAEEARRANAALLSASVGLEPGTRPADRVARARELAPDAPVVLVLRGDAIARLRFSFVAGDALEVDGLVVSGDEHAADSLPVDAPILLVVPEAVPDERLPVAEGLTVERRGRTAFLGEAFLPELVREWAREAVLGSD